MVKQIVPPKILILLSFTHPRGIPNLYNFFFETQEDILKHILTVLVHIVKANGG